ncbi:ScyD/ScyE family protein [Streptomyces sp. WMMC500]|uniref:ScyD/ScyE family protein n=1 Tax=Streptomyces sp. WMMC500 TaxID=3015154 RepID=UPI00248BBFCF|nr:ScyD/ScyE family protein [Streptomyces sp. WMMC500]WBB60997.1 ScyD/ScyE family protein [Streptomyces sp. WMMC500]
MQSLHRSLRFLTIPTATLGVLAFALPSAQSGQPAPAKPDKRATIETLATGLDSPRKVTWDWKAHRLFVAEAGETCGEPPAYCFNRTGAIFTYKPRDARGKRIVTGLPAMTVHSQARGPEAMGITEVNPLAGSGSPDDFRASIGLSYTVTSADRASFGPDAMPLGTIVRITEDDEIILLADLLAYEEEHDPDGVVVESNPYGMVTDATGSTIADTAADDIMHVDHSGRTSVFDVPPRIPGAGDTTVDPAPTAIARGRDGSYYVGELTGFPFPIGGARVWRYAPGQERQLVSAGFTNVIDLAIDRKGRVLVLEMAEKSLASPDRTGRLVRIERNGDHTVLARDGLVHPGGVEVVPNGDVYLTNRTNEPNGGELLRIRGLG